jgi:hypothetical protein
MALTALQRGDDRTKALIEIIGDLLDVHEARDRLAGLASGLDIRYDLGEGHPMLGRRIPDVDLATADGPLRVYESLHMARPVLLNLGASPDFDIGPWADLVDVVDAAYDGGWELPLVGKVPEPAAVLIRPDGYVAWVSDGSAAGLADALTTWFGPTFTGLR